ncbi:TPA_asm: hypothetical protein [Sphaeridiorhabdovirus 2]|nr:TPA_asm: hypothetical protein [Sphaeridiorhabdovirus 2]
MFSASMNTLTPEQRLEMNDEMNRFLQREREVESSTAAARLPGSVEGYRSQLESAGYLPSPFGGVPVRPVEFVGSHPSPYSSIPVTYASTSQQSPIFPGNRPTPLKQQGNPFFIDRKAFPMIVPRGSYQGNPLVKAFLLFFKGLNFSDKRMVNQFVDFQIKGVVDRLISEHNKELHELREELKSLKERCPVEDSSEKEIADNSDLTSYSGPPQTREWDEVSVWKILEEDLTVYDFPISGTDDVKDGSEASQEPPIPEVSVDVDNISVLATTTKGVLKMRLKSIPGYSSKVKEEVLKLKAVPFLTQPENRENGTSFLFIAGLILKQTPSVKMGSLLVDRQGVHKSFANFKTFKNLSKNT